VGDARALTADQDLGSIMQRLRARHLSDNTFPAEVLLELAAEAIEESGASPAEPIHYEGMRDRYLPEYDFTANCDSTRAITR
jgi:hypothetical protein